MITNSIEQKLIMHELKGNEISFSVKNLSPGIYYVKVFENNLIVEEHKLIIVR